tara:strand:- start:1444 stop:2118 length:675 start_codon:yes stop_codon:yes gene_type:complete
MGKQKKALIIAPTGLVGSLLLNLLENSNHYHSIVSISRSKPRQTPNKSNSKITHIITDFHHLDRFENAFSVDDIFCCIGTTMDQTKSIDLYKIIELYFPKTIARLGEKNKVSSISIISCIGADSKASNYYLNIKGELEELIQSFNFKATHIYRPSLITGSRKNKRLKEILARPICGLLGCIPGLSNYGAIKASQLANSMINNALLDKKGIFYYNRDEILENQKV